MASIDLINVRQTSQGKRRAAGLRGSRPSHLHRKYQALEAGRGISFQLDSGSLPELIGRIEAGRGLRLH